MAVIRHLLFVQHPYTLLALGASIAFVGIGLYWLVLRIVQYRQWASEASQRELDVIASGLSSVGRQGRLALRPPSVASHPDGLTPRTTSPGAPPGDPRPSGPPFRSDSSIDAPVQFPDRRMPRAWLLLPGSLLVACLVSLYMAVDLLWSAS